MTDDVAREQKDDKKATDTSITYQSENELRLSRESQSGSSRPAVYAYFFFDEIG